MIPLSLRAVVSLVACGLLAAQQPPTSPTTPPVKGDELRRALVDADGVRRVAIVAAAEVVLASDAAGRAKFMNLLRAVVAAAPAPAPGAPATGAPAAGSPPGGAPATGSTPTQPAGSTAPAGEPKPAELPEATRATMAAAVAGPAEATATALSQLAADKENGPAALSRLAERARLIHARCLNATLRKKLDTNAIFAGQYSELTDFEPEAIDVLLGWVKEPPRDAARAENFRAACIRALRDLVPAAEATDTLRSGMKAALVKAQQTRSQMVGVAALCALHQFGDAAPFDQYKAALEKQAASEKEEEKLDAHRSLADLHYNLGQYEVAAGYYQAQITAQEKAPKPPDDLPNTMYNAACCLSLAKKIDDGLAMLEKALVAGSKARALGKNMIDSDHDMNNLRADPRFQKLMEQHFGAGAGK